ncbi:response regulator [Candidatus Woesearchaeota archaeon]|nr:response regulator [Candidatus Woesearchaeota archaeon]
MKRKKVLIIEPDDFTRILLAKEVEKTDNDVFCVESFDKGLDFIKNNDVSLIISDDDFSECSAFTKNLLENEHDIHIITLTSFSNKEKCCNKHLCNIKKPLDSEEYAMIRREISVL